MKSDVRSFALASLILCGITSPSFSNDAVEVTQTIIENVQKRYSEGPILMKGEFFRNWSHLEKPFSIHLQTRSIMDSGVVAMVIYECSGTTSNLVGGAVAILDEVFEFNPEGLVARYPVEGPFGPENSDYQ